MNHVPCLRQVFAFISDGTDFDRIFQNLAFFGAPVLGYGGDLFSIQCMVRLMLDIYLEADDTSNRLPSN